MVEVYSPISGRLVQLTDFIASGGEGDVYAWPAEPSLVCKVYNAQTIAEKGALLGQKLKLMASNAPSDPMEEKGFPTFAWPKNVVCDPSHRDTVIGFVMPRVKDKLEIHSIYSEGDRSRIAFRDRHGAKVDEFRVMVTVARNMAEAFRLLHARGYVMVDVNERNVCFRPNGTVAFLDNDSFQVEDASNQTVYVSNMGRPEYWPPETKRRISRGDKILVEHDLFALGLFIFRILMYGAHPYHSRGSKGRDAPNWEAHIDAGRFIFDPHSAQGFEPPPHAPRFDSVPRGLQQLFKKCFTQGCLTPEERPSAEEWVRALDAELQVLSDCAQGHAVFAGCSCPRCTKNARQCKTCGAGYYDSGSGCPYCAGRPAQVILQPQPKQPTSQKNAHSRPTTTPIAKSRGFAEALKICGLATLGLWFLLYQSGIQAGLAELVELPASPLGLLASLAIAAGITYKRHLKATPGSANSTKKAFGVFAAVLAVGFFALAGFAGVHNPNALETKKENTPKNTELVGHPTQPVAEQEEGTLTNQTDSASKQVNENPHLYLLAVQTSGLAEAVEVRLDVDDYRGNRSIKTWRQAPDEVIRSHETGYGKTATFSLYINGEFVKKEQRSSDDRGREIFFDSAEWANSQARQKASEALNSFQNEVMEIEICPESKLKATPDCPGKSRQVLLRKDIPSYACALKHNRVTTSPAQPPTAPPSKSTDAPQSYEICLDTGLLAALPCQNRSFRIILKSDAPTRRCTSTHRSVSAQPTTDSVEDVVICRESGLLARLSCPNRDRKRLKKQDVPDRRCSLHLH